MRLVWLVVILLLSACSKGPAGPSPFRAPQADAAAYAKDFSLHDTAGKARSLKDYRGKVVVLFFGYTHCPDVCPTTLGDMAVAMKQLGGLAAKVQVLFVTLDPARDTAQMLNSYVPAFNPGFVALLGSDAEVAQAAAGFKAVYRRHPQPDGSYSIDHSANSYVFDQDGRLRLILPYGQPPADIAHDLRILLQGA